jgi:hypothetical protein
MSVNLWDLYDIVYFDNPDHLLESLIMCFEKSAFYLELKFYILDKLLPFFKYKQVDRLLETFEKFLFKVEKIDSYLVRNLNPIKTAVQILEFIERIQGSYSVTDFRVKHMRDILTESLRLILVNLYYPMEIKE